MEKKYPDNKLKNKIKNGETVFGPFARINSPAVVEIVGYSGFDFVIIDMEHGPLSYSEAENMVRAASLSGITPVIRVPENKDVNIFRALDTGAEGVQIPQINDSVAAEYAARSARYHPLGNRGVCKYVRSALYSSVPANEYFERSSQEVLTVLMIEGEKVINDLDEIATVSEVDVLFLGPYDLSQSLGIPGQVKDSRVTKIIEKAIGIARNRGKAVGTFTTSAEEAWYWASRGVQYISIGIDTGLLYESTRELVKQLQEKR